MPASLWRNIARYAGAHIYSETNDVVLADKSVVALHSAYSGRKSINLPGTYKVRDVVSGALISENTDRIRFDLNAPETRIFLLDNGSE